MGETVKAAGKKTEAKIGNKAPKTLRTGHSQSNSSPVEKILMLQRTIGNRSVQRLIRSGTLQKKLKIGQPGDVYEKEADRMAEKVIRMPDHQIPKDTGISSHTRDNPVQAKEASGSTPEVTPEFESRIKTTRFGGEPLPESIRAFYEPRFGTDFSQVRVHTGSQAAQTAKSINAKAFTVGHNIAFGEGQFAPQSKDGRRLIAHELTHTIQQGHAIQRSPQISMMFVPPLVQRLSLSDLNPFEYLAKKAFDFISKNAEKVPGFTMFTVVIGKNPLTGATVDRSPGNILKGAIEMMPGGSFVTEALNNHGIFDKVSAWTLKQFDTLKEIGSNIWQDVKNFVKNFSITDLKDPGTVWEKAKNIVTAPIAQIKSFAIGLKNDIVTYVKDAILKPIAEYAKNNTNGYPLLCAVMGKDPISGEQVPQDANALLGGFMIFIGEEETWANMQKAGAVPRAFAWFLNAVQKVKGFVSEIPGLFVAAFKALDIMDIVLIPRAFIKLAKVFGTFALRFISWGLNAVWNLLEIIFDSLKPGIMGYIKRTGAALKSILKNPLPFVGNLVKAAIQGFKNFADRFGSHLKAGLIDWLTGSLTGVYIPKALSLSELGKFALSVLGITWAQIRGKIVKALGPTGEKIMKGLETGFDMVVSLVKGGPAAAWELIKEKLGDLKDTVVGGIIGFVTETVIKKAVPKLIAMFIPGAGFISAIISIYDTIMVFVQKISRIAQVVVAFIDSIIAIAAGNVSAAANRVESILGGLISLAISFLAGFAGLGKVTDKIMGIIKKVQGVVDKALDWVINKVVGKAKAWFAKLFGKKDKKNQKDIGEAKNAALEAIHARLGAETTAKNAGTIIPDIERQLRPIGLKRLVLGAEDKDGNRPILAEASPLTQISILANKRVIVAVTAKIRVQAESVIKGHAPLLRGEAILEGMQRPDIAGRPLPLIFSKLDPVRAEAAGGTGKVAQLPFVGQPMKTPAKFGTQPSAGFIIEPKPEATELEIKSWNTSEPITDNNVSHAEHQFTEWFFFRPVSWRKRVVSVDIDVQGRQVCEKCDSDIKELRTNNPWIIFSWPSGTSQKPENKLKVSD